MFLLGDQFSVEAKKKNFDYYDPLTTHDSSLSVCTQSIIASESGTPTRLEYFDFAVAMDLSDVGGNMMNGAHIASIGGSWMSRLRLRGHARPWRRNVVRPAGRLDEAALPADGAGNLIHVDVRRRDDLHAPWRGRIDRDPRRRGAALGAAFARAHREEHGGELHAGGGVSGPAVGAAGDGPVVAAARDHPCLV